MRKKSKNKVLIKVLFFSLTIFLGLVFLLDLNAKQKVSQNKEDTLKEEYFLPTVSTKRVVVSYGEEVTPEMFIYSVESIYDVTYSYEKAPDLQKYGVQDAVVLVTDEVGNSAAVKVRLNIINLKEKLELNLGEPLPSAEDFLVEEGSSIFFITDISSIETNYPGNYSILFFVDGVYAQAILSVDDYEAPFVVTQEVEQWLNHPVPAEAFIAGAEDDSTPVEYTYKEEPDWTIPGEQQVTILATDQKGNVGEVVSSLVLLQDTTAPIVSAGNLDVIVGDVISYRNAVYYFDNASPFEELTLSVDNSHVNLYETGTYDVFYTVTDFAGNSTVVEAKVNVVEQPPLWNNEELLKNKAQLVLDNILSAEMSEKSKVEAIYDWVNSSIRFINFSEKDNYARGAYEGLFLQEGDCFVYAATSKYLLNMAQVRNLDIKKSSMNPAHYWNLIFIEDTWYHYDACPNKEGVRILWYTEDMLEEFSSSRGNSHAYDKTLYPDIK